ncbi:MAG: DUF805 domain-containing protein, partial [Acidobacteriota bacterium]|nr:DUF805 domain-containing protein [Acidobacteriota bacterium]
IPTWAVATRRLHDTNRSAWSLLLYLIPLVNLYFLVGLFVRRGHTGGNQYGPDPRVDTNFGRSMEVAAGADLAKLAVPGETPQPQWLAGSTGKALAATAKPGQAVGAQASARAQSAERQEVQAAQPGPSTPFGAGLSRSNSAGGIPTPSAHNQLTAVAAGC